ncbi:MAG: Mrp/NBP35 family ATP-binding protein [Actinomycetes bacterium]
MTTNDPQPSAPVATAEGIRAILGGVLDPELGAPITDLGMVGAVELVDGTARVEIVLTTLGCPLRAQIKREVIARVESLPGVDEVGVDWIEMTAAQRAHTMDVARRRAQDRAPETEIPATTRVLAIASGKGGVGKSSVTVNLAAALAARGFTVGVLDADIWGFSVPRMLGVAQRLGGSDGKIDPNELPVGPGLLRIVSMGFLVEDEGSALMWRGLILTKALEQFLTDVRWGALDYLLVDMPPGTGDVQMGLARLLPQTEMLVVTTPARAAQQVAARVADMARRSHLHVAGIVENMSELALPDGQRIAVFGSGGGAALAERTGAPLVGRIPLEPAVGEGGDTGAPVALAGTGPAAEAFRDLAARIATELLPPLDMAGCTARILEAAAAALDAREA